MNLPNKLTVLRVILIPVFLILFFWNIPYHYTAALIVYSVASITDALDGYIARKNHLVTDFGKFLDPLADKALVMAALAVFVEKGIISSIPFIIIIAREFMVSGLRLVTAGKGVVVAAGFSGKLKTAFTLASILFILLIKSLAGDFDWFGISVNDSFTKGCDIASQAVIWISAFLTIISGFIYLKGYWKYIDSDK